MKFPILYQKKTTGKIQQWKIEVEDNKITTTYGQMDGKQRVIVEVINHGKNVGRLNETSPEEQAESEAKSKWQKKIDSGFVERIDDAENNIDNLVCYSPMLAHPYGVLINDVLVPDQAHKIKFPCGLQAKYDGIRCCTHTDFTLWSRKNKQFISVPHIQQAIEEVNLPLADGELYKHELKNDFEKIVSIVKQAKTPDPEHELVEYHIYDVAIPNMTYIERHKLICDKLKNHKGPLKIVETTICNSHDDIIAACRKYEKLGYEGAIIRNLDAPYEHKRSYNLQKLKSFIDKEFPVVGIKEGKGKFKGCAIFVCKLENGNTVDVVLEGGLDKLKYYFKNQKECIGKECTIRFQGYTKEGSLRFPKGISLRDYE